MKWVGIQYAAATKAIVSSELDPKIKWARLRELCADVIHLRRAELTAERVGHDEHWLNRQLEKDHEEQNDKLRRAELFAETLKATSERLTAEAAAKAALPVEEEEEEEEE